jgi:hypothetical protein
VKTSSTLRPAKSQKLHSLGQPALPAGDPSEVANDKKRHAVFIAENPSHARQRLLWAVVAGLKSGGVGCHCPGSWFGGV